MHDDDDATSEMRVSSKQASSSFRRAEQKRCRYDTSINSYRLTCSAAKTPTPEVPISYQGRPTSTLMPPAGPETIPLPYRLRTG
jgi:hypothetical protein